MRNHDHQNNPIHNDKNKSKIKTIHIDITYGNENNDSDNTDPLDVFRIIVSNLQREANLNHKSIITKTYLRIFMNKVSR